VNGLLEEHSLPVFPVFQTALQLWSKSGCHRDCVNQRFLLRPSRRHGFEKQRMPAELQNAAMRATLKRSLRAQRRLNKSADAAAIAAGFEPPSASSWTVRFRWSEVMTQAGFRGLGFRVQGQVWR